MRVLERRRALYASTHPVEEVVVVTAGGEQRRLAAKVAPSREIAAYRDALSQLDLSTPAFVGASGDVLLLEWVEGTPLWQSGDLADWEAAARWLARLHALPIAGLLPRALFRAPEEVLRHPAAARLAALPAMPVHGEFYPSNVLVSAGRIRPLDFETFGLGAGVIDLAALTAGDWPGDEPARIEAAYLAALPARLRPPPGALADARVLVELQCAA
jgi:aminoglycoside phosphotransferase (APT) family kinase protein